jgi:quercetin 2,3-dioxygenase
MDRRTLLAGISTGVVSLGCNRPNNQGAGQLHGSPADVDSPSPGPAEATAPTVAVAPQTASATQSSAAVAGAFALGAPPWPTFDPFLFCVHHNDAYGHGNEALGPTAALEGRNLGSDFSGRDGWSMYHGETVPGFPRHPHRGFETVTLARRGFIDHSDSLGATARFGQGDVQWMTAGAGVVHAEMFPLVQQTNDNPVELFQIWLNLPQADKFVKPHFAMLWSHTIPRRTLTDTAGHQTEIVQMAGSFGGTPGPQPPPHSWASRADSDVAIWTLAMQPNATFELPPVNATTERTLYFFRGGQARIGGETFSAGNGVRLTPGPAVLIENGTEESEILLLQAKPIGEPVVQRGPFVMNTSQEIVQAYRDYRATEFGGWPWQRNDPVHIRTSGRFAIHADGRKETPT